MCCKSFWKRIVPFALAVGLGLLATNILQRKNLAENSQEKPSDKVIQLKVGTGISGKSDTGLPPFYNQKSTKISSSETKPLQVISKPKPNYTDAARQNQVQGKVMLRVTFLASGQIGKISPITSLRDGLTEETIAAAKLIKFKHEMGNKIPITVTKTVGYNFTLY